MKKEIIFITGNEQKWATANNILRDYGVNLSHKKIETPEIQADKVADVAKYSAKFAAEELNANVFVTDVGYYFNAFNGFPGPYIKYINQWLTADDLLRLFMDIDDRTVSVKGTLGYCEPGGDPVVFSHEYEAKVASEKAGEGSSIDQILILPGFDKPKGDCDQSEVQKFWDKNLLYFNKLGEYVKQE